MTTMPRSWSFLGAVACNVVAIAVNVVAVSTDIAAGNWPAAGIQAIALCICGAMVFILLTVDQRRAAWLERFDVERQIRQKVLERLERGDGTITLDDGPDDVRH